MPESPCGHANQKFDAETLSLRCVRCNQPVVEGFSKSPDGRSFSAVEVRDGVVTKVYLVSKAI